MVSLHTALGVRDQLNSDTWQLDVYSMQPLLLLARVRGRYDHTNITEFVRAPDMGPELASKLQSRLYTDLDTDSDTDRITDPEYSGSMFAIVGDWAVPLHVPLTKIRPGAPATVRLVAVARGHKPECVETGRFLFFAVHHALHVLRRKHDDGSSPYVALGEALKLCETALVRTDVAPYGDPRVIRQIYRYVTQSFEEFEPRTLAQSVADESAPRTTREALVFVLQYLNAHHDPDDREYARLEGVAPEDSSAAAVPVIEALRGQSLTAIAGATSDFVVASIHSSGVDSRAAAASVGVHADVWARRVPLLCDETAPALARLLLTPPPPDAEEREADAPKHKGAASEGSHTRVQRAVADGATDEHVRLLYTDAYALSTVMPLIVRSTAVRHATAIATTHDSFEHTLEVDTGESTGEITALATTLHEQLRIIALSCRSLRVPPPAVAMDCTLFSGSARMHHCGLGRGAVYAEGPARLCRAASQALVAGRFGKQAVVLAAELLDPLYNWLRDNHRADESRTAHVVQIENTVCTIEELRRLSELPSYEKRMQRMHLVMRVVEYLLAAAARAATQRIDMVERVPETDDLLREIDIANAAAEVGGVASGAGIARLTRGLMPLSLLQRAQELLAVLTSEGLTLRSHGQQLEAMLIWARMRAMASVSVVGAADVRDSALHASATLGKLADFAARLMPPQVALSDTDVEHYIAAVQHAVQSADPSVLRSDAMMIADRTLQLHVLESVSALEGIVQRLRDMPKGDMSVDAGRTLLAVHRQGWRRSRALFVGAVAPLQRALDARREPQVQLMLHELQRAKASNKKGAAAYAASMTAGGLAAAYAAARDAAQASVGSPVNAYMSALGILLPVLGFASATGVGYHAWGSSEVHITKQLVFDLQCAHEARVHSGLESVLPTEGGEAAPEAEAACLLGPRVYGAIVRAASSMNPIAVARPHDVVQVHDMVQAHDGAVLLLNVRSQGALRRAAVKWGGADPMPEARPLAEPLKTRTLYYAEQWLRSNPGPRQEFYIHTLARHVQALHSIGQDVPTFQGDDLPATSAMCTVDTLPLLIAAAEVIRGAHVVIQLIAPVGISLDDIELHGVRAPERPPVGAVPGDGYAWQSASQSLSEDTASETGEEPVAFRMPATTSRKTFIGVKSHAVRVSERSVYDLDVEDDVCAARATAHGECVMLVIDRDERNFQEQVPFTVDASGNVKDRTWIHTLQPPTAAKSQLTSARTLEPDQTADTLRRIYLDACRVVSQDGNSMRKLLHEAAAGVLTAPAERQAAATRTDGADQSRPAQRRATTFSTDNMIKVALVGAVTLFTAYMVAAAGLGTEAAATEVATAAATEAVTAAATEAATTAATGSYNAAMGLAAGGAAVLQQVGATVADSFGALGGIVHHNLQDEMMNAPEVVVPTTGNDQVDDEGGEEPPGPARPGTGDNEVDDEDVIEVEEQEPRVPYFPEQHGQPVTTPGVGGDYNETVLDGPAEHGQPVTTPGVEGDYNETVLDGPAEHVDPWETVDGNFATMSGIAGTAALSTWYRRWAPSPGTVAAALPERSHRVRAAVHRVMAACGVAYAQHPVMASETAQSYQNQWFLGARNPNDPHPDPSAMTPLARMLAADAWKGESVSADAVGLWSLTDETALPLLLDELERMVIAGVMPLLLVDPARRTDPYAAMQRVLDSDSAAGRPAPVRLVVVEGDLAFRCRVFWKLPVGAVEQVHALLIAGPDVLTQSRVVTLDTSRTDAVYDMSVGSRCSRVTMAPLVALLQSRLVRAMARGVRRTWLHSLAPDRALDALQALLKHVASVAAVVRAELSADVARASERQRVLRQLQHETGEDMHAQLHLAQDVAFAGGPDGPYAAMVHGRMKQLLARRWDTQASLLVAVLEALAVSAVKATSSLATLYDVGTTLAWVHAGSFELSNAAALQSSTFSWLRGLATQFPEASALLIALLLGRRVYGLLRLSPATRATVDSTASRQVQDMYNYMSNRGLRSFLVTMRAVQGVRELYDKWYVSLSMKELRQSAPEPTEDDAKLVQELSQVPRKREVLADVMGGRTISGDKNLAQRLRVATETPTGRARFMEALRRQRDRYLAGADDDAMRALATDARKRGDARTVEDALPDVLQRGIGIAHRSALEASGRDLLAGETLRPEDVHTAARESAFLQTSLFGDTETGRQGLATAIAGPPGTSVPIASRLRWCFDNKSSLRADIEAVENMPVAFGLQCPVPPESDPLVGSTTQCSLRDQGPGGVSPQQLENKGGPIADLLRIPPKEGGNPSAGATLEGTKFLENIRKIFDVRKGTSFKMTPADTVTYMAYMRAADARGGPEGIHERLNDLLTSETSVDVFTQPADADRTRSRDEMYDHIVDHIGTSWIPADTVSTKRNSDGSEVVFLTDDSQPFAQSLRHAYGLYTQRLHKPAAQSHDPATTRVAWGELLDALQKQADTGPRRGEALSVSTYLDTVQQGLLWLQEETGSLHRGTEAAVHRAQERAGRSGPPLRRWRILLSDALAWRAEHGRRRLAVDGQTVSDVLKRGHGGPLATEAVPSDRQQAWEDYTMHRDPLHAAVVVGVLFGHVASGIVLGADVLRRAEDNDDATHQRCTVVALCLMALDTTRSAVASTVPGGSVPLTERSVRHRFAMVCTTFRVDKVLLPLLDTKLWSTVLRPYICD